MQFNFSCHQIRVIVAALLMPLLASANPIMPSADLDSLWADHLLWRSEHDTVSPQDREATVRMALLIRPTDIELIRTLANAFQDLGDYVLYEAAQAYIDLLNALTSDFPQERRAQSEIHTHRESSQVERVLKAARSLFAEQRFNDAEETLRSFLQETQGCDEAIDLLGQLYLIQSEYAMANMIYSLLRERNPHDINHLNHLAYSLERIDQAPLALNLLRHFKDTAGYDPVTYGNMLLLAGQLGEEALAEEVIEEWIKADPDHPQAWTQRSHLNIYRGNLEQAETDAIRANELAPKEPAPLHYLMEIALRRGDTAKARVYADRLRELLTSEVFDALVEQGRLPRVE